MKTLDRIFNTALVMAIALMFVMHADANAAERPGHANREQSCQILDGVVSGFADNCQEFVALMEIGPDKKAFETCTISLTNVLPNVSRSVANTILVGCFMAGYGVGEQTARQALRYAQSKN